MKHMSSINRTLNRWNISKVISIRGIFDSAVNFNQPLDEWDVESVLDLDDAFAKAINFNQPLQSWAKIRKGNNFSNLICLVALLSRQSETFDRMSCTLLSNKPDQIMRSRNNEKKTLSTFAGDSMCWWRVCLVVCMHVYVSGGACLCLLDKEYCCYTV
jgi:hypothetical protein